MPLTLVVMAAGLGTRFGGPKQLEPVGPSNETLMDYILFDGHRAGFDRAVLVIREELTERVEPIAQRHRHHLRVDLVYQASGPGIPRGTVAAVLAARDRIDGPFAALNADDFYGREAYARAAGFLRDPTVPADTHAVVSFALGATLSAHGAVVRAVCETNGDVLRAIKEVPGIARLGATIAAGARTFTGDERVSMNFWAFQPGIMTEFGREFDRFKGGHDSTAELLLPVTVDTLVAQGRARVHVLAAPGPWLGLTHSSDLPGVRQALQEWTARGDYPSPVWR